MALVAPLSAAAYESLMPTGVHQFPATWRHGSALYPLIACAACRASLIGALAADRMRSMQDNIN
jgi:hypothetical protein